jgi:myo-inositol-1(or 4)-monophosphatase
MPSGADPEILAHARQVAIDTAFAAGAVVRDMFRTERVINHKGTVDLVTDADEESERMIAAALLAAFPGFRLAGEEGATGAAEGEYGWIVDPIDGTTNFAHGYPHFAVSICLEFRGTPVVGVIYDPMRDEMFAASEGNGATLNGEPIRVSAVTELLRGLGATGFSYDIDEREHSSALWVAFNNRMQGLRRDGAAALDAAWVAAGRLDAYFERPVNAWDVGAGVVIVREAGGSVSGMRGEPYRLDRNEAICTNGHLHAQVVNLIAETLGS